MTASIQPFSIALIRNMPLQGLDVVSFPSTPSYSPDPTSDHSPRHDDQGAADSDKENQDPKRRRHPRVVRHPNITKNTRALAMHRQMKQRKPFAVLDQTSIVNVDGICPPPRQRLRTRPRSIPAGSQQLHRLRRNPPRRGRTSKVAVIHERGKKLNMDDTKSSPVVVPQHKYPTRARTQSKREDTRVISTRADAHPPSSRSPSKPRL